MKKKYFLLLMIPQVYLAQVGIGTTSPANTLDVNGWIKVGNESVVGASSVQGSLRYNAQKKCMEFYDGTSWACIGQPKMETTVLFDAVDANLGGSGITNYTTSTTGGYGGIRNFSVNNVAPSSRVLFLVEIALHTSLKVNGSFANTFKIYGNGVFQEYKIPAAGMKDVASFFVWGSPNNVTFSNLTFSFESNQTYNFLKITTLVF